jgi:hypothetical protein
METINDFDFLLEEIGRLRKKMDCVLNTVSELNEGIKKVFPTPHSKKAISFGIAGGIIGGGIRGDYKGGKRGGTKGGGKPFETLEQPKPKTALKDFSEDLKRAVKKHNESIFRHLTPQEMAYLNTRDQFVLACKAYEKLNKLGYNDAMIEQAIFNAFRDQFWQEKFRHFKALANTSKNGVLVIENLLKIGQSKHKLSHVKPVYKG